MQRRESGIANLLGQLRDPAPAAVEPNEPEAAASASTATAPKRPRASRVAHRAATPAREAGKGAGRPKTGKRSNPDYGLHGLWLREETYHDVVDRLRRRREFSDASELVQALLEGWLKKG